MAFDTATPAVLWLLRYIVVAGSYDDMPYVTLHAPYIYSLERDFVCLRFGITATY